MAEHPLDDTVAAGRLVDEPLEVRHLDTGLHTELVGQSAAEAFRRPQRLRGPPGPQVGQHEHSGEPLPLGMGAGEWVGQGGRAVEVAELDHRRGEVLDRLEPAGREPSPFGFERRALRRPLERLPVPQLDRLGEQRSCCGVVVSGTGIEAGDEEGLEATKVDRRRCVSLTEVEHIPVLRGADDPVEPGLGERPAHPQHQHPEGRVAGAGPIPDLVLQPRAPGLVGPSDHEERDERPCVAAGEVGGAARTVDLDRTQESEPHPSDATALDGGPAQRRSPRGQQRPHTHVRFVVSDRTPHA